jgi:hypothetical protein
VAVKPPNGTRFSRTRSERSERSVSAATACWAAFKFRAFLKVHNTTLLVSHRCLKGVRDGYQLHLDRVLAPLSKYKIQEHLVVQLIRLIA